jgi:hypothetical protein
MTSVPARGDDTGSIVFGWLGRITLTLAIIGLIGFEVLSIAVTQVGIADAGATAGDKALTVYADTHDPNAAYLAADQYVTSQGAELVRKTFEITPQSVTFEVKKTAPTLLLFRWDRTAKYAEVRTKIYEEPIVTGSSSP